MLRLKKKGISLRILFLLLGLALFADFAFAAYNLSINVGVIIPLLLAVPLILIGVFYPEWQIFIQGSFGSALKILIIIAYAIFIVSFMVVSFFIYSSAKKLPKPGADAVIVLGAALKGNEPSKLLALRLDTAIGYLGENPETIAVVSGGQSSSESISESKAMANYLYAHGIDESRVILEDRSSSTEENLKFSVPIIEKHFGKSIHEIDVVFASSAFHIHRAKMISDELGFDFDTLAAPSSKRFLPNHVLREYIAILSRYLPH